MTEEVQRDVDSKGKWQRGNGSPTSGSHTQQSDGETEAASPEGKRRLPRPSCPSVPHAAQNCKNPPLTSPSISLLWKHLLFLNFLGSFPIFSCQLRLARRTFCASERINAFAEDCYIKTLTWLIGTWEPCVLDPTSHSILPRYSPLHSFLHKSPPPPPFHRTDLHRLWAAIHMGQCWLPMVMCDILRKRKAERRKDTLSLW